MATIACQDCGHEIQTNRVNTKYDSVCRLIRDIPYTVKMRNATCELCDASFQPLDIHDTLCGRHSPPSPKHGEAECRFCGNTRIRCRPEIDVCDVCARDADVRKAFFAYLETTQATRRGDKPQTTEQVAVLRQDAPRSADLGWFVVAPNEVSDKYLYVRGLSAEGKEWLASRPKPNYTQSWDAYVAKGTTDIKDLAPMLAEAGLVYKKIGIPA